MRLLLLLPVLVQAVKRDRGTPTPDHARAWFGLHADQELEMQHVHHDVQRRNLHDWLLGDNYEGLLLTLVDANPALVDYLRRWTISYTYYDSSLFAGVTIRLAVVRMRNDLSKCRPTRFSSLVSAGIAGGGQGPRRALDSFRAPGARAQKRPAVAGSGARPAGQPAAAAQLACDAVQAGGGTRWGLNVLRWV